MLELNLEPVSEFNVLDHSGNVFEQNYLKALRKLSTRLIQTDIKWAITGSLGHALRLVPVVPNDIDILTDKKGAFQIERLFAEFILGKVRYTESESIRSYFGTLILDGVTVEIIGDIENRLVDKKWEPHTNWDKNIERIEVEDFIVPVLSLEYEYMIYKKLLKHDRAELLKRNLSNQ